MKGVFLVGFGREDISPKAPVPLAGYGATMNRISRQQLDTLYLTCVAITDAEGKTALLISQDLINSLWHAEVRSAIREATGIPEEQILVAATHTHSGPDQVSKHENILAWKPLYLRQAVKAALAALEDRAPATVEIGRTDTERLNFIRHYLLSDGSYGGDNFGDFKTNTIVDHATPNDPRLQVIRFRRRERPSVVMVNWQAHPTLTGGMTETDMSSDFIGSTRQYVEQTTGELFIYFTGAAGNHNAKSRIRQEERTRDNREFGKLLGDYVLDALQHMTSLGAGTVKTCAQTYVGQVDHSMEEKLEEARAVRKVFQEEGRDEGNKLARQYGFSSVYHANAVVRRSSYETTRPVDLHAISIGGISFAAAPYEMFAAHGMYIKEHTPFPMTFVVSCCNGVNSYLPTTQAYDYGCYESHNGNFVRGTGDKLAEALIEMLKQLK